MFKFSLKCRSRKRKVHFLHVGKTGGTAVKFALKNCLETESYSIQLHAHDVSLRDIPSGEFVFFFLRDPISRFISAFYSRQRKGYPRYYCEWNNREVEVFGNFASPNEIAVAIANRQSESHELAKQAMSCVVHFRPYNNWYIDCEYFNSRLEDILFVGFQETLENDFLTLKDILKISEHIVLPSDEIASHKNTGSVDKFIEQVGVRALTEWYADDFQFIETCKKRVNTNLLFDKSKSACD